MTKHERRSDAERSEPSSDTLHPAWLDEIEQRARRALASPDGGIPWEIAEARLRARRPG